MNKRIVFLYSTEKNRYDISLYEKVIRALMRKYRCSPLFSYLQLDTSLSCREKMCELIHAETSRRGAIFFEGDAQNISGCMDLINTAFGIYASSHHISGRTICYPEQSTQITDEKDIISCTSTCKKEDFKKALDISLKAAKKQKHSLSVCLAPTNELDSIFFHEAEIALGSEKHIGSGFVSLDEMISLCIKTVPSFDVILTTKDYASIIAMHLNSMPVLPTGYIVSFGDKHKIYRRQILPGEKAGNLHYFSALLSLAAVFENEFEMKSAADWLRRALSLAFLKESTSSCTDYISTVIKEIETPIRKRRTE